MLFSISTAGLGFHFVSSVMLVTSVCLLFRCQNFVSFPLSFFALLNTFGGNKQALVSVVFLGLQEGKKISPCVQSAFFTLKSQSSSYIKILAYTHHTGSRSSLLKYLNLSFLQFVFILLCRTVTFFLSGWPFVYHWLSTLFKYLVDPGVNRNSGDVWHSSLPLTHGLVLHLTRLMCRKRRKFCAVCPMKGGVPVSYHCDG